MKCSKCGCEDTKVLESRLSTEGRHIRRRRACRQCDHRFTTYEREERLSFHVKKKDGFIEPYQREKALHSIQVACRKRPVRIEEIEFLLGQVESKVAEMGEKVIPSGRLGNLIMEGLSDLDQVAYIRFCSVYQDFKDPTEFASILSSLPPKRDSRITSPML